MPLFDTSPTHKPRTADDWYQRGCAIEVSASEGDPDSWVRACEAYQRALALDPKHAASHTNLGRLMHEAGQLAMAESHYRHALRSEPNEATYWYNLGVVLEDRGPKRESIIAYRTAVTLNHDLADAHFNLARLLEHSGDAQGAFRHMSQYRRLLGTEPDAP